jgi:PIN domain nuclease of toxin-antitoxin system
VSVILDASALLAFLNSETGADIVEARMAEGASMSSVNLSEVVAKLNEQGMPLLEIKNVVSDIGLQIEPFDEASAYVTGELRQPTKQVGLSLGDRVCLALGIKDGRVVLTADRAWQDLKHIPGLTVELIR